MNCTKFIAFENKTTVITGGTSGIGYQMVRLLNFHNDVIVVARPSSRLDALKKEFPNIKTFAADLSKPEEYKVLSNNIMQAHPRIDVLINNAAIQYTPSVLDESFLYDSIEQEINLNFTSVCALSYLLLPALLNEEREAVIININSGLALAPKASSAIYCATKGAINIFSQSIGYQLENTNVRVMQAFLPLVDTPMTKGRGDGKISPRRVAMDIVGGIEKGAIILDIGKVKKLRLLLRFMPRLAHRIMRES